MNTDTVSDNIEICGVLVQTRTDKREQVATLLREIPGVEIHASTEQGSLIITVESDSQPDTASTLAQIQTSPGVISATLIYHHSE